MTFLADLRSKGACSEGIAWAEANGITSVAEAWAKLTRSDWMFWLARHYLPPDESRLRQFAYECADRAVHIHAVAALRSAGLADAADRLAALPQIMDTETALAGWSAADEARSEIRQRHSAAGWDADAARDAADAARDAARAAWDAADAAWDTADAAWDTAAAARDAAAAARITAWITARDAEDLWQADRLRELFPEGDGHIHRYR